MADVTTHELDPGDAGSPKGTRGAEKDKDVAPSIQWLLVESRHVRYAAGIKKDREAYQDYIIGLVFKLDGQPVRQPQGLTKKVIGQIVTAFEERFGEAKESPGGIGKAL